MSNGMQYNSLPNKTDFQTSPSVNLEEFSNVVWGFEPAKQLSRESHLKHKRRRTHLHLGGERAEGPEDDLDLLEHS